MFGFGGVCSKSFSALFYKPGLLWRTNTILGRYQGLSIATLNDLNTYSCKAGIYSKTDVSSSVYTRQSAKKISKKQLFHTTRAAASSGISLLDWWSPVTLTYGSLIAAGGITGYVRTRSVPSLLSGVVSALLLFASWHQNSPPLAFAVSLFLSAAFFMRFRKTKKLYPSGILGAVSVGASAFFGYLSYWS